MAAPASISERQGVIVSSGLALAPPGLRPQSAQSRRSERRRCKARGRWRRGPLSISFPASMEACRFRDQCEPAGSSDCTIIIQLLLAKGHAGKWWSQRRRGRSSKSGNDRRLRSDRNLAMRRRVDIRSVSPHVSARAMNDRSSRAQARSPPNFAALVDARMPFPRSGRRGIHGEAVTIFAKMIEQGFAGSAARATSPRSSDLSTPVLATSHLFYQLLGRVRSNAESPT
jgi:hypothetical protein